MRRPTVAAAIDDGVAYLVASQQPDGCWGTGTVTRGLEILSMVPGSHDGFRVATTALGAMALREAIEAGSTVPGAKEAHDHAVKYLVDHGTARRDNGAILYNVWAHTFALQALCEEIRRSKQPDERLVSAARAQLESLDRYATHTGGWNYYDFQAQTQSPSLGPTSFGTAAGLVALWSAREAGLAPSPRLIDLSLHRLAECRLPDGTYLYGSDYKYNPRLPADMGRGSVGRIQPCNYALWLWGWPLGSESECAAGLQRLFDDHAFIEMGRKRPWPHESWYQTSGYYYYFDHYYAALILERLNPRDRSLFTPQLVETILPHQEADGSWWDYAMWDYHKPYGTAFAVMTLLRCR